MPFLRLSTGRLPPFGTRDEPVTVKSISQQVVFALWRVNSRARSVYILHGLPLGAPGPKSDFSNFKHGSVILHRCSDARASSLVVRHPAARQHFRGIVDWDLCRPHVRLPNPRPGAFSVSEELTGLGLALQTIWLDDAPMLPLLPRVSRG